MTFKDYIPIILGVLKDFRVIGTVIAMLLVVAFSKYIINYTKKPKVPKQKKAPAPKKEPPKPAEGEEENEGGDEDNGDNAE